VLTIYRALIVFITKSIQLYHDPQHTTLSSSTNLCKILKTIIFNIKTITLSENKRLFSITVFNINLSYNGEICELLKFQIYYFILKTNS